jgi:hypothetical protein
MEKFMKANLKIMRNKVTVLKYIPTVQPIPDNIKLEKEMVKEDFNG